MNLHNWLYKIITRKSCYRKETARCSSCSLRFKVRRHSVHTYMHTSYLKWPNVKKLLNHCRIRLVSLGLRRGKNAEINIYLDGCRKQGAWEQWWCCAVDCSEVGCRQPGRHGRPRSPAALIGQSVERTTTRADIGNWCRRHDVCRQISNVAPETPENEDGDFEVDTLSGPQPVKLPQKRCDVLAPTCPVDESGGSVEHWL